MFRSPLDRVFQAISPDVSQPYMNAITREIVVRTDIEVYVATVGPLRYTPLEDLLLWRDLVQYPPS